MDNVELAHRPGMEPSFMLSWEEGGHRFHVWIHEHDGTPSGHVFRNPIDPTSTGQTVRFASDDEYYQYRIEEAWRELGNRPFDELKQDAKRAAKEHSDNREADIAKAQLARFRTAFAQALTPYPRLREGILNLPDDELFKIGQTLLRIM